jgi:hypothetical protein
VNADRDATVDAGRSAAAGYWEARALRRKRRAASVGLWLLCAVVLAAGAWAGRGAGRGLVVIAAVGLVVGLGAWRIWPRDDPDRWLRGSAGERATASLLAGLARRRWIVLHDRALPYGRANVDHLVIGPSGVWVVDTKAYRAPLVVSRGRVWAGEHAVPTDPAARQAAQVAEVLDVEVVAIVAVHGDGLRRRGKRCGAVWVVPADRLIKRLRRRGRRRRLTRAQVADLGRRAAVDLAPYR